MNLGYQSARTYWALVISGKTKAGWLPDPRARAAAPPRSRSQYHKPKAITLLSQIAPPLASRMLASLLNVALPMIPATRRTAAEAFTAEIRPISVPVSARSQAESRSMRPGSPMTITLSSTRMTTMNTQRASPVLSSGGRTARSNPAASTASAIGQRCSPALGDRDGSGLAGTGGSGIAIGQLTSRYMRLPASKKRSSRAMTMITWSSWASNHFRRSRTTCTTPRHQRRARLRSSLAPAGRTSKTAFCGDLAGRDRVDQGLVVAFVLVGVGAGEFGDGPVEGVGAAEVGGDRDPVAGPGVRPGQGPAAQLAVHPQAAGDHGLDVDGELPVA